MGGKSTFLRQVALISLMAQIGSFVPVGKAELALVDRIFTRIGTSDYVAEGCSCSIRLVVGIFEPILVQLGFLPNQSKELRHSLKTSK